MSIENLQNKEAIEKLKEMINPIDIGMLCTHTTGSKHVHAVPMSTQEVDEDGNIWFLFSSESDTHKNLLLDKSICLLYSDPGNFQFLSIHANTEILRDQERINQYWNKMVKSWFDKEKEDPAILLLKVVPAEAHYWDTKSNKLVTFFKMIASGITGEEMNTARSGELKI